MKTDNRLSIKRALPTLLGMALLGGLSTLPTLAQSDQNRDTEANARSTPAPQDSRTVPESITSYILDFPDYVVAFPIPYPTFSGQSANNDVVLWPSQESIDNGTGYIYLLRGNTLYQENVNTLDVVHETTVSSLADNDIGNASRPLRMHRNIRLHRNFDAQTIMTDMGLLPPAMMTTNGDYLYVVRGNTLYQFYTPDMSLTRQTQLPDQTESIQSNNTTPDEDQNGIDNDRLDETHPDNIGPGKTTDDNGANDESR